MASTGKQLNMRVNFQMDTTQAKQQLQGLQAQLNQIISPAGMHNSMKFGITQEIMQATKAAAQLKAALTEATSPLTGALDLTAFNSQLKMSGMTLANYKNQLSALGPAGNESFTQLTRAIATAETPLLKTGKAAQTLWTTLGNTLRWQATSMAIHGIVNTASQAMSYVKSLDKSLNSIQIVTGQSADQMSRFARQANEAAKELNTTTNEYAKASLIYYQQGLSNKQVEERTKTTIKLANVAGQSAKTASDQLTAIWNNFYDGSKSLEYYADVITALGASTASSSEEIAKGLQKFSSIAKTTGLSYEYATTALSTVVATTRQSADSVGTAFKTLFSRLQGLKLGEVLEDGTTLNKYSQALMTIGVNIKKANGDLKDMDTILNEIGDKWKSLAQDEKVALAQTVGGARNYNTLLSLMDNWDTFQENLKTAQSAQGTLQTQANIYAESWKAASDHVKAASETIYKNLLDDKFFKGLTHAFGYVLDSIGAITNGLGGFGGTMTGILALASHAFAPQMSNMFTNIGMNLTGRSEAIKMQQDAIALLKEPVMISNYNSVNKLATNINSETASLIAAQKTAIDTGKMSPSLQVGYNQLMNLYGQYGQEALQAAEISAKSEQDRYIAGIMEQARLNAASNKGANITEALHASKKKMDDYASAHGTEDKTYAALASQYGYIKQLADSERPAGFIRGEEEELRSSLMQIYGTQGLQSVFRSNGLNGTLNEQQMINAIGYTKSMFNGAGLDKDGNLTQEGATFLKSIYGDKNLEGLKSFYGIVKNIGPNAKLSADQLRILNGNLMDPQTGLIGMIQKSLDPNEPDSLPSSYSGVMEKVEAQVKAMFGGDETKTSEYMGNLRTRLGENVGAEYERLYKEGRVKEAGQYIKSQLAAINEGTAVMTGGQASTRVTQTVASVGTTVLAAVNAVKTFGNENATAQQKAQALVTTIGTMPMAIMGVSKIFGEWNTKIEGTNMTMGKLSLTTLAVTGAILGIVGIVKELDRYTDSAALKRYDNAIAAAQQRASDAKASYEESLSLEENYKTAQEKIKTTDYGTSERTNSIISSNEIARAFIEQYKLQYGIDYTYDSEGKITIGADVFNNVQEQEQAKNKQAQQAQGYLTLGKELLTAEKNIMAASSFWGAVAAHDYKNWWEQAGLTMGASSLYNYYERREEGGADAANRKLIETTGYNVMGDYVGNINIEHNQQVQSAIQGLAELTGSVLSESYTSGIDLAVAAVSSSTEYQEAVKDLVTQVNNGTVDSWMQNWFGKDALPEGSNLKQIYQNLANEGYILDTELPATAEEQRAAVIPALIQKYMINGYIGKDGKGFEGLEAKIKEFAADEKLNPLLNFKTLTEAELSKSLDGLKVTYEGKEYYDKKYAEVINTINQTKDRIQSDLLESISTYTSLNYDGKNIFERLIEDYTLSEQEDITGYLTSAGTAFGEKTTQVILSKLGTGRNVDVLNQLSKVNWDNTFSALGDINKLARNLGGHENIYSEILNSAIEELGREGGLFKKLYDSSGFQNILDSLIEQFDTIGYITAENISKLSAKSEELSAVLGLSNSQFTDLKINAAGIASALNAINKGYITSKQVNSALLSSLSVAGSLESEKQNAFNVVDNQNLGRSGTDLLDYFTNGQKAYLNAKTQNLTYDTPLRAFFDHMMPVNVKNAYYNAIANGNQKSFDEIIKELPKPIQDFLNNTNRKGTKSALEWSDIIDLYGGFLEDYKITPEGQSEMTLAEYLLGNWSDKGGLRFANGNIELGYNGENPNASFKLTTKDVKDRLITAFSRMMSEEDAKSMAEIWLGYIANTSAGYELEKNDAQQAVQQYIEATQQTFSSGEKGGNKRVLNKKDLDTMFYTYGQYLTDENGKPISSPGEYQEYIARQMQSQGISYTYAPDSQLLKEQVWNKKADEQNYKTIGHLYNEANGLKIGDDTEAFKQLLEDFGVTIDNKNFDLSRFYDLIEFLGGSIANADTILENSNGELGQVGYTFKDKFGNKHTVTQREGESYEDYSKRRQSVENEANSDYYWDPVAHDYVFDPLGKKREERAKVIKEDGQGNKYASQEVLDYWTLKNSGDTTLKDSILTKDEEKNLSNIGYEAGGEIKKGALGQYIFTDKNGREHNIYSGMEGFGALEKTYNEQQYYSQNKDTILGAAKDYKSAIEGRIDNGLTITDTQQQFLDLYNAYEGLTNKNSPFAQTLLKYMDQLLENSNTMVDQNGELVNSQQGDENARQGEKGGKAKEGKNGEVEDVEGHDVNMPEEEHKGGTPNPSGANVQPGSGGQKKDNFVSFIADNDGNVTGYDNEGNAYTQKNGEWVPADQKASGQNNNKILGFATGKKSGQIAVTGELGPELRIKEDGSAELLGKHGREYAWIEPNDKIYTATQTAGILGNNNISMLEGLSKGINNFIPGYYVVKGSGSGNPTVVATTDNNQGGHGSNDSGITNPRDRYRQPGDKDEDHTYDPNWLQYRDVIERYYTILQQIEDITNAVTRFSEIADRAWGKQRQEALRETIKLQEEQIDAQKRYLSEIKAYFKGDKETLTTMIKDFVTEYNSGKPDSLLSFEGAEFDENGVLTNYRAFVEELVDQFNENGSKNAKEQYKFQERLKDIQQYTETLNLLEEQQTALEKMYEALFDAKMNEIQVVLEYKLSLSQDQTNLIDYALGKIKNDAYEAAKGVALIGEKQEELVKQLINYEDAFKNTFNLNFNNKNLSFKIIQSQTSELEDDLQRLEKFKEKFKDEDGNYQYKAKFEDPFEIGEVEGKKKEHTMEEYYASLLKYYTEYYNQYSDLLPDPDDFFIWSSKKDEDKKDKEQKTVEKDTAILEKLNYLRERLSENLVFNGLGDNDNLVLKNEEEVLEKLNFLRERLKENTIFADVDKFTGSLNNLEEVNEQVNSIYDTLITKYPELVDSITKIDDSIIELDGKLNVQNYSNLVKILELFNEIQENKMNDTSYNGFLENAEAFFTQMSDNFENPDFQNLTNAEVENFRDKISNMLQILTQLQANREKAIEYIGDSLKAYFKDINAEVDNFDHIKDLYKDWVNILDLTGRTITKIDHQLMSSLQDNITDNYKKKLAGVHDAYKLAAAAYDDVNVRYQEAQLLADQNPANDRLRQEANSWKEQLATAEKNLEEAESTRMQSLIDLLERLQEEVTEVFKNAAAEFEDSFSPFYNTLEMLQTAFDREQQLQDLYLDAYDQAHDLSKLNRDIQLSIDDTDNLKGKQELKKLLKEINDIQKAGNKLTQYDVDNLQRQYEIELARQALEDARNAKSLVRLARDNNGNWSYVYTANEEDVEEAEQNFEDKLNESAKANEDRIKELSNNFIALQQDFESNLENLKEQDLTPEAMEEEANKFYDAYLQQIGNTIDQLSAAFGNNQDLIDTYGNKYGDLLAGLTTDFAGTILSTITGVSDLGDLSNNAGDQAGTMMDRLIKAYKDKYEEKKEAWGLAELNIDEAAKETEKVMDELDDRGTKTLSNLTDVVLDSTDAFGALITEVDKLLNTDTDNLDNLITKFETLVQRITDLIAVSGEYTETIGKMKIDGLVDDWEDLDNIYKALMEHSEVLLQYMDEHGNIQKMNLAANDEDTMAQLDAWRRMILGDWDAETWTGNGLDYGFDKDKAELISKMKKGDKAKISQYLQDLVDEIAYQGIDRLEVSDKLYTKLKEKGVEFESENEAKKRATIFFDAIEDSEGIQNILETITEIFQDAFKSSGGFDSRYMNDISYIGHRYGPNGEYVQMGNGFFYYGTSEQIGTPTLDTGGYTGRWQFADTGMYTGEWPNGSVRSNGRLAWLHQKELVLNTHDTENFLDAMEIVRELDNLTNWMANGLGILAPTEVETESDTLEQNVHIEASFPNVTDHNQIEQAFENIVNLASQYANRK